MELGDVTQHNLKQLRKLNSVIFPVSYSDKVGIYSKYVRLNANVSNIIETVLDFNYFYKN